MHSSSCAQQMSEMRTVAEGKKRDFGHQRKQSFSLGVSVITGGGGRGRMKGRKDRRKKGRRREKRREAGKKRREREEGRMRKGKKFPLLRIFFSLYTANSLLFFRFPFPDPHRNSEPPIVPAGWQTAPVLRTGCSHLSMQSRITVSGTGLGLVWTEGSSPLALSPPPSDLLTSHLHPEITPPLLFPLSADFLLVCFSS